MIIKNLAGAFAFVAGLLSFVGWAAGIDGLTDWTGSGIVIKANAAIAACAAGAALLMSSNPRLRWPVRALALFVATLGGLTLLEHITSWNFGIDTLLFDEAPGALATASPGRMGPPASTSFLAIGVAFTLLTGGAKSQATSVVLGLGVLAVATLSIVGHGYGAEALYMIPRLTGIALQTATMLAALAVGIVAANPTSEPMRTLLEDSNTGLLARRIVPLVFLVPPVIGWLRLRGQALELYDSAFGTALRTLIEATLLAGLVWWSLRAIRAREQRQQRAEHTSREHERRLIETIESINDGLVTLDRDWRFTYVNQEAERLLGRPRSELLGQVVWKLFPETVDTEVFKEFQRVAASRTMVEVRALDPTGTGRYFVNRVYPGTGGGVSVYFQDITERKRAEDALEDADRRKDDFIATLAHELRNPLAPIRNAATLLTSEQSTEPLRKWAAEVIARQVRHMAFLLDDLLDVARISRNQLDLKRERIVLKRIIEDALETSRPGFEGAGHELAVALPHENIYVDGDAIRLTQVFSNLLNNAAKFTEPRGHIRLTASLERDEVLIAVEDDGIGISEDTLPHVFEMFAQAKPALDRSHGGLGIGLSLARRIVEMHGGSVAASSAGIGKGSTFVVRLPRVTHIVLPAHAGVESVAPLGSKRFLVVDDSKDSADSLAALLNVHGHDVRTAYDGAEAIKIAQTFRPEAIFLDIGMPEIDGFEVARRIRKEPWGKHITLVALTGWGQAEDRRKAREAGFDEHLVKPADAASLLALLSEVPQRNSA